MGRVETRPSTSSGCAKGTKGAKEAVSSQLSAFSRGRTDVRETRAGEESPRRSSHQLLGPCEAAVCRQAVRRNKLFILGDGPSGFILPTPSP
ncbi:MAG: hypothetical protein HYX78_10590 [Armatimonadetes bacterium]|nr:hypothetical protein [Armatimonadota bacterium]